MSTKTTRTLSHALAYGNITLSVAALGILTLYIYLVVSVSVMGALHQGSRESVESMRSRLATLETDYLDRTRELDLAYAHQLGLVEKNDAVSYVVTKSTAVAAAGNR